MKTLYLLLLFCIPTVANAQAKLPYIDGKILYEKTFSKSSSKDELFSYSKKWFAETFVDSRAVIRTEDKDAGEIIGKAYSKITGDTFNWMISNIETSFFVLINVKDNKARIRIYDIQRIGVSNDETPLEQFDSSQRKKKPKKVAEWSSLVSYINKNFDELTENYSNKIDLYIKDKF